MHNPQIEQSLLQQLPKIVKAYQLPDHRKATVQILNSFLPFLAVWVAMYLLLDVSKWFIIPGAVVNAFFLVRIFIIQHDCGHQSFTASRRANDIIGQICSYFSFIPYKYWAKNHNFHHGHNGILWEHRDIGDIKLLTVEEFAALSRWEKLGYMVLRNSFVLFVLAPLLYIFYNNRFPIIKLKGWEHANRSLFFNNVVLLVVHGLLIYFLGWQAFLLVHLPILAVFGTIALWFFYVQHQHETTYKDWKDKWDYLRAAMQGSTFYKLPRVFNWLTGNIGYHHIHHLNPLVPNYQLQRCHHENPILDKLANKITFIESLKCMFNKLWDEEQQRMISFRDYFRRQKLARRSSYLK